MHYKAENILYWILNFIVTVIVAWVVLSLVFMWFNPVLYNENGELNWWVTLWVAALIILFAWIFVLVLNLLGALLGAGKCHEKEKCHEKKDECDPCDKAKANWTY